MRLTQELARTYLHFDARSLGLFRIVYGVVLLTDLCLRSRAIDTFYTNAGLLPNHTLLWAPPTPHMFSLFFTASNRGLVIFLMLLCAAAFSCLLVGYRTKLAQVASFVALTSMNARLAPLENGGDMVMNLLGLWTLFLPLGQRFSVDAVLASLRGRSEHDAAQLQDRSAMHAPPSDWRSLAVLALILQFFVIYLFNVVHKSGPTWLDGTAVHYTLHQDRLIKPFGVWMRLHVPPEALRALTYGAVVIESIGAVTIISPFFTKYTRAVAVVLMPLLHLGFELCLDLGVFSFSMMSYFALLLAPEHWSWLARVFAARHRRRIVYFDASCGVCFACTRLLSRLDLLQRLEFVANTDSARLPAGTSAELFDTTIVVVDAETGKLHTKARAFAAILLALPCGFLVAWLLVLPGLRQLADLAYEQVAKNRAAISSWLGFAACGVPSLATAATAHALPPQVTPARASLRQVGHWAGQLCVAVLMAASWGEIVNANAAAPLQLRYRQPELLQAVIEYPRLYQGWRMFAPHAPTEDFNIEIDAVTVDGRHVDPYNEVASAYRGPGFTEISPRLHQNQFFTAYSLFIWRPGFRAYLTAFREWILRYPERTGRANDRIVRFQVSWLSDQSPPPGKYQPTGFKRTPFMHFPE